MLSAREEELINAVARGHSNAQIASTLGLDEAAVQEGIAGVLKRLGVSPGGADFLCLQSRFGVEKGLRTRS